MNRINVWDAVVDCCCRLLCAAFWWRFRVIPQAQEPEQLLLGQLLLWKSAKLEVYLQHFDNPEPWDHMHCHEWPRMRSFVLSGDFTEERAGGHRLSHGRFTTYTMDQNTWHHVTSWGPRCWTLFVCSGGRTVARGYRRVMLDECSGQGAYLGPFIPWRQHILKRVKSLTGIETP